MATERTVPDVSSTAASGGRRAGRGLLVAAPDAVAPTDVAVPVEATWDGSALAARCVARAMADAGPAGVAVLVVGVADVDLLVGALGRPAADLALRAVGRRLVACAQDASVLRLAVDRFVVVVKTPDDAEQLARWVQRLREVVARPLSSPVGELRLCAAVGVAFDRPLVEPGELVCEGEIALEAAFGAPDGGIVRYDPRLRERARTRLTVVQELDPDAFDEQLRLVYQPIVHLDNPREIVGVEALVRWADDDRGLVSAGQFASSATAGPLGQRIDAWVLEHACRQWALWARELGRDDLPTLTVNVSPQSAADAYVSGDLAALLHRHGVPAQRLALEVAGGWGGEGWLEPVRELGVSVLADGLRGDQAVLGRLVDGSVDGLKLSRSIVHALDQAPSAAFADLLLDLAARTGLAAVAVGVESEDQAARLMDMGCRLGQGRLWAAPMDGAAMGRALGRAPLCAPLGRQERPRRRAPEPQARSADGPAAALCERPTTMVKLSEVCDLLEVSPSTVRRWADQGRIATLRTSGGHRRFRLADAIELRDEMSDALVMVRARAMPAEPAPAAAQMLRDAGVPFVREVAGKLYEPDMAGWFVTGHGKEALATWMRALTDALEAGDVDGARRVSRTFLRRAELAGASLIERFSAVDRTRRLLPAVAQRTGHTQADAVHVQRVLDAVLDMILREAEAGRGASDATSG